MFVTAHNLAPATDLALAELCLYRRLGAEVRELVPAVVVTTPAWDAHKGDLKVLVDALDLERQRTYQRLGSSWQMVQVRHALDDGRLLVVSVADDWSGNDYPEGIICTLEMFKRSGRQLVRHHFEGARLDQLPGLFALTGESGCGDFFAQGTA